MSADPTAGPSRPPEGSSTASDPAKCDPHAGTVIAVNFGKSLPRVNRDYDIFTEWMLTDQKQAIAVDLRTCEVFGDPLLPDLIRVPGAGFALGYWDPWERRYATNPDNGFRLWKATPCDVIRWCNYGGYIYPRELIAVPQRELNGPAETPRKDRQAAGPAPSGTAAQPDPPEGDRTRPPATGSVAPKPERPRKAGRTKKPPRPTTLKELAAAIRRDHPRQKRVPRFLDLIADNDDVSFEEIEEKAHQAVVVDEAIEKTIAKARKAIIGARLPIALVVSDRRVSKRTIPRNIPRNVG
jgi:hypothetical protein